MPSHQKEHGREYECEPLVPGFPTADDLLQSEHPQTAPPQDPQALEDAHRYDMHMHKLAKDLASSASIALACGAAMLILAGFLEAEQHLHLSEAALMALILLVSTASSARHALVTLKAHRQFMDSLPPLKDFYTPLQKQAARSERRQALTAGIVLTALSLVAPLMLQDTSLRLEANGIMVLMLSAAAWFTIYFSILGRRVDIARAEKHTWLDALANKE